MTNERGDGPPSEEHADGVFAAELENRMDGEWTEPETDYAVWGFDGEPPHFAGGIQLIHFDQVGEFRK